MPAQRFAVRALARAFLAGDLDEDAMVARARGICGGKKLRWLRPLARRVAVICDVGGGRPREARVAAEIRGFEPFQRAWAKGQVRLTTLLVPADDHMRPAAGAPETWKTPPATNFRELTELLGLHPDDLGWLTSFSRKTDHYHYTWLAKGSQNRDSSGEWLQPKPKRCPRLIESPKPLLKSAQITILRRILAEIPPHEAACAFRPGMSVFDFARPHVRKRLVLKLDLEDFFPSITIARVIRLFVTAGYPENVAVLLARLCTNSVAPGVLQTARPGLPFVARRRLEMPHVPQGAPSSPALANLCAFRLDCRLAGLARAAGADYTRYADDLLFSGGAEFARQAKRFHIAAAAIVLSEGFRPNLRKTRFMPASRRQHAAGLVLNEAPNVSRAEFDRLKAILTNCRRLGWKSQNRDNHPEFRAHLLGRIGWIASANSARGEKLRDLFAGIEW